MICFISGLEASGTVTISPYFEGWSLNLGHAMGLSLLLSFTLHFLYLEMPCSTLWSFPSLCRATILYFIKPLMNQSFFFFFLFTDFPSCMFWGICERPKLTQVMTLLAFIFCPCLKKFWWLGTELPCVWEFSTFSEVWFTISLFSSFF